MLFMPWAEPALRQAWKSSPFAFAQGRRVPGSFKRKTHGQKYLGNILGPARLREDTRPRTECRFPMVGSGLVFRESSLATNRARCRIISTGRRKGNFD